MPPTRRAPSREPFFGIYDHPRRVDNLHAQTDIGRPVATGHDDVRAHNNNNDRGFIRRDDIIEYVIKKKKNLTLEKISYNNIIHVYNIHPHKGAD